jgi:hypothetical protein
MAEDINEMSGRLKRFESLCVIMVRSRDQGSRSSNVLDSQKLVELAMNRRETSESSINRG